MPNRRRRKLSTAMSAVAALAVASPFAVVAATELTAATPAPQEREFTKAAVVTDLPNELMSALTQGLSQFGVNLPPLPTGLSPAGAQPLTGATGLTAPTGLGALTSPTPALATPLTGTAPPLTGTDLTNPALTPALTSPTGALPATAPGLTTPTAGLPTTPGLTTPLTGTNPLLTDPAATVPGLGGLGTEQPISAPIGLDPMAGTYPILGGDPSLAAAPAASGGIVSDLSSAAQQLGAGQAIDLLKGVLMPSIMGAIKNAAPAG